MTAVLNSDHAKRVIETTEPVAWIVVSQSTNWIGHFGCKAHALDLLNASLAPSDAVMFECVKSGPGVKRAVPQPTATKDAP